MSQGYQDEAAHLGGRLAWALRQYARPLAILAVIGLTATAVTWIRLASAPREYTATASLIAEELAHDPANLPRLVEAVAHERQVLQAAISDGGLPYSPTQLQEQHLEIRPVEANVLVLVDGKSTNPRVAVFTANAMVKALVDALNEAGSGVGQFKVYNTAISSTPDPRLGPLVLAGAGGLFATTAAVLGLAGLLLALRRPVTDPRVGVQLSGQRLLGVIDLGGLRQSNALSLLAAPAQELEHEGTDRVVLLSAPGRPRKARALVAVALARSMRTPELALAPSPATPSALSSALGASGMRIIEWRYASRHKGPLVAEGLPGEDTGSTVVLPPLSRAVVVVTEGQPEERFLRSIESIPQDHIAGLIFVRRPGRLNRAVRRLARALRNYASAGISEAGSEQLAYEREPAQFGEGLGWAERSGREGDH